MSEGLFISLEGIDGSGKTTLIQYLQDKLATYPLLRIREPGGTAISEKIRELLLNIDNYLITARTEAILYAAARSQVVEQLIKPALDEGKLVLADRYVDSTMAYQGYGRGLDLQFLFTLNQLCTSGLLPDATILLDITPQVGEKRRKHEEADRLEKEGREFQARVREGYLRLAIKEPKRFYVINANREFRHVAEDAWGQIMSLLIKRGWLPGEN